MPQDFSTSTPGTPDVALNIIAPTPSALVPALSDAHRAMLMQGSGISDAIIRERGYTTCATLGELKSRGVAIRKDTTTAGLLIPIYGCKGIALTHFLVKDNRTVPLTNYRPDVPQINADGKIQKYVWPVTAPNRLDCHPRSAVLMGNPSVPLWLTEGTKKADALVSHGAGALALNGVWGWRGRNKDTGYTALADWEDVALKERDVRIVFDSDVVTKPSVDAALKRFSAFLVSRGARVTLAYLPSVGGAKVGVDDFLLTHTLAELEGLLQAPGGAHTARRHAPADAWQEQVERIKGRATQDIPNIALYLEHHPDWAGKFWLDVVRDRPMVGDVPLSDATIIAIARWLGKAAEMSVRSTSMVEKCVKAQCAMTPRDLLREWIEKLPKWDDTPRLRQWLSRTASIPLSARLSPADLYCMDVSRVLIVSMVARALDPGCQYRFVVIFEGLEDIGKSKLVRALATPEWYVEISRGLEGKESHMMLQGVWVAELAELEAYSRTEEARMKAFITIQEDAWIPKFSNLRTSKPRRTIFIGTTNEKSHLRGLSGNTRFLPLAIGAIDLPYLDSIRDQLFAEALVEYRKNPETWWQLSPTGAKEAVAQRENRRVLNVYEEALSTWLPGHASEGWTTWVALAEGFLKLENKERWKDLSLQKQVAQALTALGWRRHVKWENGKCARGWTNLTLPICNPYSSAKQE